MKLLIDNQKVFLNWKYDNELVSRILHKNNISFIEYRKMNTEEKLKALGLLKLPTPNLISCIARDAEGKVLGCKSHRASKTEIFDKETFRRKSLQLLLSTLFPNVAGEWESTRQRRKIRTEVWNSYWSRGLSEKKEKAILVNLPATNAA